jgi:hypothetical protein
LFQSGLATPEVDVCGGEVVDALVVSLMIVMIDERFDLRFEVCSVTIIVSSHVSWRRVVTSPVEAARVVSPASHRLLASIYASDHL